MKLALTVALIRDIPRPESKAFASIIVKILAESIFNVTSPVVPPSNKPLPAITDVISPVPPPPPPVEAKVIVSPAAFVVSVIFEPATNVKVSVAPSATTSD